MEAYSKRLVLAEDGAEARRIAQEACNHYAQAIAQLLDSVPDGDMPFVIACADTIRATMEQIAPRHFETAALVRKNLVAVAVVPPGGKDNGQTKR